MLRCRAPPSHATLLAVLWAAPPVRPLLSCLSFLTCPLLCAALRGKEELLALTHSPSASPSASSSPREENAPAEPLRRPGTLTPEELASLDGHDALQVAAVSKRFVKSGRPRWLTRGAKKRNSAKIVRAVDDVTLTIHRREIFGVLGSNGSGKSTLIRLISTLLLPDEGKIEVFGHDVEREARTVHCS